MGPVRVRTSHKIPGSLALSVQNQGPIVRPRIAEIAQLGRTMNKRRKDILADIRHTINAP
ncbi:hypothetical protein AY541_10605 [Corynebacterium diphtheriae bv. mitis]|nr:hypothetical protein AY541_10605 [Corynebacterium diphtheriae bv. mitis]